MEHSESFRRFLNLAEGENPRAAILPLPFESTTHFQFGTAQAPATILRASQGLESFDPEFKRDLTEIGVLTITPQNYHALQVEEALKIIEAETDALFDRNLFPILLGGESILSLAALRATQRSAEELGYLRWDSRARAREAFEGNRLSSSCLLRRASEEATATALMGLQEGSQEDFDYISTGQVQNILSTRDLKNFPPDIYLSISTEVFASAEVPGTSFQSPVGLSYARALAELKEVFSNFNVLAVDICDLRPLPESSQSELFVGRLIAKILALKFWRN